MPAVKSESNIGLSFPVVNVFLGILHVVRVDFFLHFVNFHQVLVWVHQILGPDDECRLHMMVVVMAMDIMVLFWVLALCCMFLFCGFWLEFFTLIFLFLMSSLGVCRTESWLMVGFGFDDWGWVELVVVLFFHLKGTDLNIKIIEF